MMEQTAYATATPVLYELSGVEKSCEGPAERITILKNMDLTVRAGESLAIVGASGSGKLAKIGGNVVGKHFTLSNYPGTTFTIYGVFEASGCLSKAISAISRAAAKSHSTQAGIRKS